MIYFRTCAYNAENTLKRAVDSVLNQTYGEFLYYILDNGSTDKTGDMIREYAQYDKRIVPFYNKRNRDYSENTEFWNLSYELSDEDYFIVLDADDYYDATFLEEMMSFRAKYSLDIVACGTRFFDATTGNTLGEKVLSKSFVLDNEVAFGKNFPNIHWNLRQVWGKVYTAKAARARFETELPEWYPKAYGGDTVNVYECVKASERIGVYGKILHHYAASQKSVSHKWIEGREKADITLFEKSLELLKQKCGFVSQENMDFLYSVYYYALLDTIKVLIDAELDADKKIFITKEILMHPITKKMLMFATSVSVEDKKNLLKHMVGRALELHKGISEKAQNDMYDILIGVNTGVAKWVSKEQLAWYLRVCPSVLFCLVFNEYQYAINNLVASVATISDLKTLKDFPLILGQNLAALQEAADKYLFFSKKLICWYVANECLEQAKQELKEWMQILPEDKDLRPLYEKYLNE